MKTRPEDSDKAIQILPVQKSGEIQIPPIQKKMLLQIHDSMMIQISFLLHR